MAGEFEESDGKSHWLWPAIIVGMATLFVVLLVTTVLVWLPRPGRVEPDVAVSQSVAKGAGDIIPAGDPIPSVVPPAESPAGQPAVAEARAQESKIPPADSVGASPAPASPLSMKRDSKPAPA